MCRLRRAGARLSPLRVHSTLELALDCVLAVIMHAVRRASGSSDAATSRLRDDIKGDGWIDQQADKSGEFDGR